MGWLDFAYPELKIIESFHNNGNSVHFLKKKWTDTYPDANPVSTQKINPLAHFLSIQKGDYIVVPLTGRTFTICEALDSAIEIPNLKDSLDNILSSRGVPIVRDDDGWLRENDVKDVAELGFIIHIHLLTDEILRSEYADAALTSRMKIRCTTASINDIQDNVLGSLQRANFQQPLSMMNSVMELAIPRVIHVMQDILNENKMEKLVSYYLEKIGASEVTIPPKNAKESGDCDVQARFDQLKLWVLVQVKHHKGTTPAYAVQQIIDYKSSDSEAPDGYSTVYWVISSAEEFALEAKELAAKTGVTLINGTDFSEMLIRTGINFDL